MPEFGKNLRIRMFGLEKEQVYEKINAMKSEHKRIIDETNLKIDNIKYENSRLAREIDELKLQLVKERETEEFMKFASDKVEEYIPLFNDKAVKEVLEINSIGEKAEKIFNQRIAEFSEKIKGTHDRLNYLLQELLIKNDELGSSLSSIIEEGNTLKYLSLKEKNPNFEARILTKQPSVEYSIFQDEKLPENLEPEIINVTSGMERISDTHSDFWEDVSKEEGILTSEETAGTVQEIHSGNEENKSISQDNKQIIRDAGNISSKYLIGKIAGIDLLDRAGRVIIPKNSIITEEVLAKANKEGKLAELIVNMTLLKE